MKLSNAKKYFLVFLLALMFSAAYLLPYIKYIFNEQLMMALGVKNAETGLLLSVYAIMNTLTLIPGGFISDKYPAKRIIVFSSLGTGLLNWALAAFLNYQFALIVWILLGFTTIFAFWGAVIKAVRLLGDEAEQGRLYGFYAGFQGVVNTLCATIAAGLITVFADQVLGFRAVLGFYGFVCIAAAVAFWFCYPDELDAKGVNANAESIKLKDIISVLKMPATWLLSFILFSVYSVFSGSTFFTDYVTKVLLIGGSAATLIAIFRTYVARAVFCPVGGFAADRVKSTSLTIALCSAVTAALIFVLNFFGASLGSWVVVALILIMAVTIYMNFGIMWAVSEELKVPRHLYGTVIGVASIIGYLPDAFMHTMFGNWLDTMGNAGYSYIFMYLAGMAVFGIIIAALILLSKRKEAQLA